MEPTGGLPSHHGSPIECLDVLEEGLVVKGKDENDCAPYFGSQLNSSEVTAHAVICKEPSVWLNGKAESPQTENIND